jgi:GNAT superfamily N-acetyltransferase
METLTPVTVRYLEMARPEELKPAMGNGRALDIVRAEIPLPELNRFLYVAVGRAWQWVDRLPWSRRQWLTWLDRPELETYLALVRGTPAGYFELDRQPEGNCEIAYIGLLPAFIGQGLGGLLVTRAVERAWAGGARRVWLHTCSLDHPAALANYLARGFRQFRVETVLRHLPDPAERPWYG